MIEGVLGGFLALLAGFAAIAILVASFTSTLPRMAPGWFNLDGTLRTPSIVANIAWSILAATGGGYVTAYIARENPLDTALALAIVILVLSGLSILQSREKYPMWYLVVLLITSPVGVVAGGLIRVKQLGAL